MILGVLTSVLDKVIPDTNQRKNAKEQLLKMQTAGELELLVGQLKVNQVEAAHKSIFVAGWRPFIGWILGIGMFYSLMLRDILTLFFPLLPDVNAEILMPALLGMLGLVGARSYEKVRGVSREK